jgi:hypothetical protein
MDINFITGNCSYLKYYLPLIIEFNKRGISSNILLIKSKRYSDPYLNIKDIKLLSSEYHFNIDNISNIKSNAVNFQIEGSGCKNIKNGVKISLTSLTDFQVLYDKYIDNVNYVIFPSKYFAEYYGKISNKNLYLGSPKYDTVFDIVKIRQKYDIKCNKNVLILFPRNRDVNILELTKIYNCVHKLGYNIIVKTRGKDRTNKLLRGDKYFEDFSWFPHTTMELMLVCDFIINFDSTSIKECVMLNVPIINFRIKPFVRPMEFLYNYSYCKNLRIQSSEKEIEVAIHEISNRTYLEEFNLSRKKYLFEKEGVAKKIVDFTIGLK